MLDFLKILFLSNFVSLTPNSINIIDEVILELEEPISAITGGASIRIEVTDSPQFREVKNMDINQTFKFVKNLLPDGSVRALLKSNNGKVVILDGIGTAYSQGKTELVLSRKKGGVPTNIDFHSVKIMTNVKLNNVKVYWKNWTN